MAIEKPTITHKYITLFNTEAEYTEAYPEFSEANWSDVGYPENTPDTYRISRRLSNMYHKNTPPDYKFDGVGEEDKVVEQKEQIKKDDAGNWHIVYEDIDIYPDARKTANFRLSDYTDECIRKTFFLEVVWGYSGWEWVDYRRILEDETEETLTGGNMYEIENIVTVPHIIDGDRLYHINDFLNSQDNVTTVLGFNTENLVAANRAFKRRTETLGASNSFLTLTLADSYDEKGVLLDRFFGYGDTLANLEEADELFKNTKVVIDPESTVDVSERYINMPKIKSIDKLMNCGVYTGIKFKMESLEELTGAFALTTFTDRVIDVNSIFLGDTLKQVKDLNHLFYAAYFNAQVSGEEGDEELKTVVNLDLTDSEVSEEDVIDLSYLFAICGPQNYSYGDNKIIANTTLEINLDFNHDVNLDYAFCNINMGGHSTPTFASVDKSYTTRGYIWNGGFQKIHLNLNGNEEYIRSLKWACAGLRSDYPCRYIETPPITQVPNNNCDDTKLYGNCVFNADVTYDFLNGEIETPRASYGQFNGCTFNTGCHFLNLPGLDRVELAGISFGENVPAEDRILPVVQNQNNHTYRYFDIRGSQFTGLMTQNIYIDALRFTKERTKAGGSSTRINPFYGCSQLTDVSNVHIYYPDLDDVADTSIVRDTQFELNFTGCTNMTRTPYIHFNYYRKAYSYFIVNLSGLRNLTEVNFENFTLRCGSTATTHSYKDCVNLRYLKIATNTETGFDASIFDIRGCISLDIETLQATLQKFGHGIIAMLESTWNSLNRDTQLYCLAHAEVRVTDDNEYDPTIVESNDENEFSSTEPSDNNDE